MTMLTLQKTHLARKKRTKLGLSNVYIPTCPIPTTPTVLDSKPVVENNLINQQKYRNQRNSTKSK